MLLYLLRPADPAWHFGTDLVFIFSETVALTALIKIKPALQDIRLGPKDHDLRLKPCFRLEFQRQTVQQKL